MNEDKSKFVDYERLREEAIKWIKLLKHCKPEYGELIPSKDGVFADCDGVIISKDSINFIMHFFNITKEELI